MNFIFILVLLFVPTFVFAQGGPPMVTDDPGTPGDKHWEINIVSTLATNNVQTVVQIPYFDINYGWGERTQLKLETGWVTMNGSAPNQSGAGTATLGVKYRFLDEKDAGISMSIYPQLLFHHFFSSHDPDITSPGNQYIFPMEMSKTFGNWEINPDVGYIYGTTVTNNIFYGVVLAFENAKPWEPMAEVHVNTYLDGTGSSVLLNLGLRYSLSPKINLLAAAGHAVTHIANGLLEYDGYLGLQLDL